MAKRVCVIDIGSNSIRMAIYEKTSRFAFHILYETKSKVRLSQNAYQNSGNLQEDAMQRTYNALKDFLSISKSFDSRKILCVATSALRDAPNKKYFLKKVRNTLKLNIKIINGEKEAYLGAIACANLLPKQTNALSIDIGGGSTEFSFINKNNVSNTLSLELGTVRLKELFFDTNNINEAVIYIDKKLAVFDNANVTTLIGIGGTFRALIGSLISTIGYPLNKLHGFEYSASNFIDYINLILAADDIKLKELGIKTNRLDIIKPGTLILQRLFMKLSLKTIVTSGVGVREGVYLADLLRNQKDKFPHNYNTSLRYIIDSHIPNTQFSNQTAQLTKKLFDLTATHLGIDQSYCDDLVIASKLYPAGSSLHFFSQNRHTYYLIKSALEYGYTHSQVMLIATLVRYAKNKFPSQKHIEKYKILLPDTKTINTLSYLLSLSIALLSHKPRNIDFNLEFNNGNLKVISDNNLYLTKEAVNKITQIEDIKIIF